MMDEEIDPQHDKRSLLRVTKEQVVLVSGTMLAATGVDLLAHLGPTGLVVGGILAFAAARHGQGLYEQVREALPSPAPTPSSQQRSNRSLFDWALGRFPDPAEEISPEEVERRDAPAAACDLLQQHDHTPTGVSLPRRLTIDEIVRHS